MKNMRKTLIALAGVGGLLTACSTGQPSPGCFVQSDEIWFLNYERTSASSQCTTAQLAFNGEEAGVVKYRAPGSSTAQLAIRPFHAAELQAANNVLFTAANSVGNFNLTPNADKFCEVGAMNEIAIVGTGGTTRYQFSNVRTYAGARSLGLQVAADLVWTSPGNGGNCVINYKVKGMWPITGCTPGATDAADNCGEGSGVNQDVAWKCVTTPTPGKDGVLFTGDDVASSFCAQAGEVPSYKPGIEELEYADE